MIFDIFELLLEQLMRNFQALFSEFKNVLCLFNINHMKIYAESLKSLRQVLF